MNLLPMCVTPKRESVSKAITKVVIEAVKESMALREIFDSVYDDDDDDFFFSRNKHKGGQVKEDTVLYQLHYSA